MKSISTAFAAVALGTMVTLSAAPPAEAGPLRDALKKQVRDARFVGAHFGVAAKCVAGRILRRPKGPNCAR
jgi:hypothetical protein